MRADLIRLQADMIATRLAACSAAAGDAVVCISDSQQGCLAQWTACQLLGILPVILPAGMNDRIIPSIVAAVSAKAIVRGDAANRQSVIACPYSGARTAPVRRWEPGGVIHATSATTGQAKLILRTRECLRAEVTRYVQRLAVSSTDTILSTAPLAHSYAFGSAMLAAAHCQATLVDPGRILSSKIVQLCASRSVTILHGAPFMFQKILEVGRNKGLGPSLRTCIASGGPMLQRLQQEFQEAFGLPLLQQYGCTELGSLAVSEPGDPHNCVGKPLSGVHFDTATDADGCEYIRVRSLQTAGSAIGMDGSIQCLVCPYHTGDVGTIDATGRLFIHGRKDDIVAIVGRKVSLRSVQAVLELHPLVRRARVYVRRLATREELWADYVSNAALDPAALAEHCANHLGQHQIPRGFARVGSIVPQGASWKR